jgi:GT2 family glycosyltransferase/glycosyltransferase involved in cell wall biosynthesis
MSLRDVEPVKGFLASITDIRNRLVNITTDGCCKALAETIRMDMDRAFRELYGGMGSLDQFTTENMRQRGWKFDKSEVEHPERADWPSVCIVIPVFNSPELLKACLVSLMRTDYPGKLYWMCVDNASTNPETLKILASQDFTPLRFEEPVGFSAAVNAGMKACEGFDYYVLFNQDCVVSNEDWLTQLINWMEIRPKCAIAGSKLLYPDGRVQHAGILMPKGTCGVHRHLRASPDIAEVNYYEKVPSVTGAVYAIRRSVLGEIGYLDEGQLLGCEDTELCLRAAAYGYEVWYVPDSEVIHRDNAVRKSNPQDQARITSWAAVSDKKFRGKWGKFVDRCANEQVAIVLPDFNPVAGGCRVVAALANSFITAGMETTVYEASGSSLSKHHSDLDLPMLFDIKPLSELGRADTLIATRFDTVDQTRYIMAARKFYLVQQIETAMAKYCGATEEQVLASYRRSEYEIVTIGEHLAKALAEFGRQSTVLDVGLYRDLYPKRPDRWLGGHTFRVLMYASPADYKGADDLPVIAAALRELMGSKVEIMSFHRDFKQPEWSERHFQPKSTSEVAKIYASADAYIYASRSDGFAMTPVEAMACGTPVIMTDFPGKDQYAVDGENCLIVPFMDFEALAATVLALMVQPDLWQKLSDGGAKTADKYDWSKVSLQYLRTMLGAPV